MKAMLNRSVNRGKDAAKVADGIKAARHAIW